MDTSSNDSFTWAHTSNHSSNSDSDSAMSIENKKEILKYEETKNNYENSVTEKKAMKRKLKEELAENESSVDSPKNKKIKVEENEDTNVGKKKRKKKDRINTSDITDDSKEDILEEFDYLNLKVKEEQIANALKSKKNKKNVDEFDENHISHDQGTTSDFSEKKKNNSKNERKHTNLDTDLLLSDEEKSGTRTKKRKGKKNAENNSISTNHVNSNEINFNYTTGENNSSISAESNDKNRSLHVDSLISSSTSNQLSSGTPRILDRIRFEDETDSDTGKTQNSDDKNEIKKFLKRKNSLKLVLARMQKSLEISDDDEVWILKCPYELSVADLKNKDLLLDSKSKIKVNGETYNGSLDEDIDKVTVMTSEKDGLVIKNIKVNGVATLRKRLPKPHCVEDNVMADYQTDFIPLPETKCRHPLFGSKYKKSLKIPEQIAQQLKNIGNISTSLYYETKKKKKHKKEFSSEINMNDDSIDIQPKIETDGQKKKTRKRKYDNVSETQVKKAKQIKKEPDSSDVWESEKAIEENLFNF